MNISDKILRAKADLDSVYEAGVEKGRGEATNGVTVEPLEVAANGTYTAPNGVAYSPVKVNVPDVNGSYDEGYEDGYEDGKAEVAPEDLNDVLTAQEEKLAELSAILDKKAEGGNTEEAYNEGFEDGKKAEYDAFWDAYQQNGKRVQYTNAFSGLGWTDETFKPKYDIRPSEAGGLFSYTAITDVKGILEKQGVVLDLSNLTGLTYLASGGSTKITRLPELNVSKLLSLPYFLQALEHLKSIDKVILKSDGSQDFTNYSFGNLTSLEEIRFEGVIGKNGLNLQWSTNLSHDSLVSIINALSTTTSGLSITLSKTAVDSAFATTTGGTDGSTSAEWTALVATRSNWTISLA